MTRLLLDTHLVLWWLNDDPRLPAAAVERVHSPDAEVFVRQASLWEMAIKVSIGRLQVDLRELEHQIPNQGFRWLPIRNAHLLAVAALSLMASIVIRLTGCWSAKAERITMLLLTADRQLKRYGNTVSLIG